MYSNQVKGISISYAGFSQQKTDYQLRYDNFEGDFMIYKQISEDQHIKRGVYGTKDVFEFANYIKEGRFFVKQDFKNDEPVTVIGSEIWPQTTVKDGIRYYAVNDSLFKVIGVFKKTGKELDNTIFLNLNYLMAREDVTGLYYIDSKETNTVNKLLSKVEGSMPPELRAKEIKYEKVKEELHPDYKRMFFLVIITALCNLIITSHFFVIRQKYKTAVKKLCGLTNRRIAFEYSVIIAIIIISSFAFNVILINLLNNISLINMDQLSIINYVLVFFLLLLVGGFITYQIVRDNMKVDISATLKG